MEDDKVQALLEQQNRILSHIGLWITRIFFALLVVGLLQVVGLLVQLLT